MWLVARSSPQIFGARRPIGPMYAFVGIKGMAKMSSSKGNVPTPLDGLRLAEPQLLRWLYARRRPNQAFDISFDQEIHRLYDEWDATARRVAAKPVGADAAAYDRAVRTVERSLPQTARRVPFRTLASIVDITMGDEKQTLRILGDLDAADPVTDLADMLSHACRARPGGFTPRWGPTSAPTSATSRTRNCSPSSRIRIGGRSGSWSTGSTSTARSRT